MTSTANNQPNNAAAGGRRIRVLVVDDSAVVRHLVTQALSEDPEIEVVGAERNGTAALAAIPTLRPDVVTLDVEMPEMNGLEALRQIRSRHARLRTVMLSSLTSRGAAVTLEALSAGADDYLPKAVKAESTAESLSYLRKELIPRIKQFFKPAGGAARPAAPPVGVRAALSAVTTAKPRVLAIGCSTGGPQALADVLKALPAYFALPVVVVQHMPPVFTKLLAERLSAECKLKVAEATEGAELVRGRILLAPGDYHLKVRRSGSGAFATLDQGPQENSCRPSVDVLFRSLAQHYRNEVLSVVLTGMGNDGLAGATALRQAGSRCLVQDEATSVVWGMPGAIARAGLANEVLPLNRIAAEILKLTA
jgi:two-component system chemotaxis response regulator CheB